MGDNSEARWRRLALGGAVYLSQGTIFGFATFVLIPSLAARGVALEVQAGVLALAGIPWVTKIGWALLVDAPVLARVSSRLVIAAASGLMALLCIAIASVGDPSASVGTLAWLWFGLNLVTSLQDVATDALVVDEVPEGERGLTEGVLLGGHHVGAEGLGALVLGALFGSRGLGATFGVVAALLAALSFFAWTEHRRGAGHERARKLDLRALADVVRRPGTWAVGAFAAAVVAADIVTGTVAGQFLVGELGWPTERFSNVLAPVLLVANLVGFVIAARIGDRLGHGRSIALGGTALGGLWVGFAAARTLWIAPLFIYAFAATQAVATALMYVGLYAWLIDRTELRVRATHFAALMALVNLPRVVAPAVAPTLLEALGYPGLYAACGVFQILLCCGLFARATLKGTKA